MRTSVNEFVGVQGADVVKTLRMALVFQLSQRHCFRHFMFMVLVSVSISVCACVTVVANVERSATLFCILFDALRDLLS